MARILIIEDDSDIALSLKHNLEREGDHVVAVVSDGVEGLRTALAPPAPDLVLLDLNLPGRSGISALKLWRSRLPAVPVVVLSATDDAQTVLAAMDAGAAGFIPKSSTNEVMETAARLVLAGGKYLPAEILARRAGATAALTPRNRLGVDTSCLIG